MFKRAGLSQAEKVKRSDMCHFLLVAVRSFLQSLASVCSIEGSLTEFDQVHRQTEAARLPGLKLNRLFFNSASRLLTSLNTEAGLILSETSLFSDETPFPSSPGSERVLELQ